MAITLRTVQNKRDANGLATGKQGTVYDVNIKYTAPEGKKTYAKRGFLTRKDASQHEAEMRTKLLAPNYNPATTSQSKLTLQAYLAEWVEAHGKANLRPSTFASYKSHIKNHIVPNIGHVQLRQLTPAMIDGMIQKLYERNLSTSTVRYAQRILSVSLEHARKYRYIETNPARNIITKLGKQGKTPSPYTIPQMQALMGNVVGTEWEMTLVLGGMYGLRISEVLGLRWRSVDLENGCFGVVEQLPFRPPAGIKVLEEWADVKNGVERYLPITDITRSYFLRQQELQQRQRAFAKAAGRVYHENDLVVARPDGAPYRRETVSAAFGQLLRHLEMPHMRFHDTRHTAATNMHQLTGDFFTVGEILGHSLKGVGISLGISTNLAATTSQYVDVRLERKQTLLDAYHNALHQQNLAAAECQTGEEIKFHKAVSKNQKPETGLSP